MGITSNDIAAQRAMLKRGEEKRKADWKLAERERLRDTFAAAALTGLLSHSIAPEQAMSQYIRIAAAYADAMLRERGKAVLDNCVSGNNPEIGCQHPTGNAQEPVAWAVVRWFDNAISLFCFEKVAAEKYASDARGDTCYRHDVIPLYRAPQPTLTYEERQAVLHYATEFKGPNAAILRKLLGRTSHDAVPEAIAANDGGTPKDADGTGNTPSEAEIDALEFVVEEGRTASVDDYGILRSWLIRLRPEWESQSYEESNENRTNTTMNRDATPSEGSVHPTLTDEEREAMTHAADLLIGSKPGATLRSLLERLHT